MSAAVEPPANDKKEGNTDFGGAQPLAVPDSPWLRLLLRRILNVPRRRAIAQTV